MILVQDVEKDWETIEARIRASVEHIFNNYQYCSDDWCYHLQALKEGEHSK